MPADLDAAKYVSFTTYKKDGHAVSLPVWVVPFDDGYAFTTSHDAFKVKRVRRDPRATLAVSTFKGLVAPEATVHQGSAVILDGPDSKRVADLVRKKYRVMYLAIIAQSGLRRVFGRASHAADTAIKVTLTK
ncbi:MAG: PPOX class F420-dependent oxidoreductase [Ilumatobacteraceae bacterium]|nr:PPOX class F420-dependent oxidoreductase [Ilumatobacteraceae bacterium]